MKKSHLSILSILLLWGLVSCTQEPVERLNPVANPDTPGPSHISAEVNEDRPVQEMILEFAPDTADLLNELSTGGILEEQALDRFLVSTRAGAVLDGQLLRLERLFPDAGEWEARHREAGLHKWYKATLQTSIPATRASEGFKGIPGVVSTEIIPRIKRCAVPVPFNDPYAKRYQWHLINDGSLANGFVSGCDINVVPAWQNYGAGSSEVIVSVVDDGIYYDHPDLKGVVIPSGPEGSKNFVDTHDSSNPYDPYKIVAGDHGTHVAGIIGAVNNNNVGVCGIAGGSDGKGGVRLMSCQIFQDNPKDPDHPFNGNSAQAIVWGADHGAVISQNSWGYEYDSETQAKYGTTPQSMKSAIDYFRKNAGIDKNGNQVGPMKGGVVIFAAGNDGWAYGQPADYPPVIAVGATGPDGRKATYTNYGGWVDICAPGGEFNRINANGLAYIMSLATQSAGSYVWMCGTSMACPMVSGVAALAVSVLGGPGFTNEMLEEMLLGAANPNIIPAEDQIGPMVDAFRTIDNNIKEKVFFDTEYKDDYMIATGQEVSIHYNVTDKENSPFIITLTSDGTVELVESDSNSCTIRFDSSEENVGTHKARLTARRVDNTYGFLDLNYVIYTNQAPEIKYEYPQERSLKWFERETIALRADDPEGRKDIKWTLTSKPEGAASLTTNGPDATLTIGNGKGEAQGNCEVIVTASDWLGAETGATFRFSIQANQAPIVVQQMPDILLSGAGDKATLSTADYIQDPDGEQLDYQCTVENESVATLSNVGNSFFLRGGQEGMSTVTLTARDGLGKTCNQTFRVGVYDDRKGPTAYPNPVKDRLNIRIGAEKTVQVQVSSEMGAEVLKQSATASIFQPMSVDMSSLAPGRYTVRIEIEGQTYVKQIVKL